MILLSFAFCAVRSTNRLSGFFKRTPIINAKHRNSTKKVRSCKTMSQMLPPTASRIKLIAYVNGKNGFIRRKKGGAT